MISQKYVGAYMKLYDDGKIKLNKERVQLFEYLKRDVLSRPDVWFDEGQIEDCINYIERNFFPLADFQKFLIPFSFLMIDDEDGESSLFYDSHFWTLGRGGGKNGLISGLSSYFLTPAHNVPRYQIGIVANSEEQAMTSFDEIYDMIEMNKHIQPFFYKNKQEIRGVDTNSTLKYRTSNVKTKDSFRDACVIFDEIHQYETNEILNVFESGLGKVPFSRVYYIGTNGFVRDGVYDQKLQIARDILDGTDEYTRMFPFICTLDDPDEKDDFDMWEKANPMFSEPRTSYAKELFRKRQRDYYGLRTGATDQISFMVKNMNTLVEDTQRTAVPRDELLRASRPLPDNVNDLPSIGAVDFASSRDFSACGVLTVDEDKNYYWQHHSFINQNFLSRFTIKAPLREWEKEGHCTIIDAPLINEKTITEWFVQMREKNPSLNTIMVDSFKYNSLREPLEQAGFTVQIIKNPRAASGKVSDKIDRTFASGKIAWGDNPMMRWYTNNVYVKYDASGNKNYEKKEEVRRKTDGFMALVYAFFYADEFLQAPISWLIGDIDF